MPQQKYTALVVDDERIILEGLVSTYDWEAAGFQVVGKATDGLEALALIREQKPDVVMTDIRMADMDGLELIRRVDELGLDTLFIVISAYRDFDYAKQACDLGVFTYLLKPFNSQEFFATMQNIYGVLEKKRHAREMEQLVERHRREIVESRVKQCIQFGLDESAFAAELLDLKADIGRANHYCCLCIDISLPVNGQLLPGKRELQLILIREKLSRRFPAYSFSLENGVLASVLYGTEEAPLTGKEIDRCLHDIASALSEEEITLYCCYGDILSGLSGLAASFRQASEHLEYTYESGLDTILPYAGTGSPSGGVHFYPDSVQQEIFKGIMQNSREAVAKALGEFDSILSKSGCTRPFRLNCYYRLTFAMKFFLSSSYGENIQADRALQDFLGSIPHLGNDKLSEKLGEAVLEALSHTERTIAAETSQQKEQYISQSIRFIEDNLENCEFSVIDVADALHLNPIYFGRVFKNATGKSFREYLMNRRLHKAKQLLETGGLSVTEVCFRVGINSQSYFSTSFKKLFGILPSQIQRL